MCRLTGFLGTIDNTVKTIIFQLLYTNAIAGNRDGVGIGCPRTREVTKFGKSAMELSVEEWQELIDTNSPFIGHVRLTSTGLTAIEGSHPFISGELMLAHNGTLNSTHLNHLVSNDSDPVDSHVATVYLDNQLKGQPITDDKVVEGLAALAKEFDGTFIFILGFVGLDYLYVALRGSRALYYITVGDNVFINTTKGNLVSILTTADMTQTVVHNTEPWTIAGPEQFLDNSVFKVNLAGVTKIGDLPVRKVTTTTYYHRQSNTWTSYSSAKANGEIIANILDDDFSRYEIEAAVSSLAQNGLVQVTDVYSLPKEDLLVLERAFRTCLHYIDDKYSIWEEIIKLADKPYTDTGLPVPWMLSSAEELRAALARIKQE